MDIFNQFEQHASLAKSGFIIQKKVSGQAFDRHFAPIKNSLFVQDQLGLDLELVEPDQYKSHPLFFDFLARFGGTSLYHTENDNEGILRFNKPSELEACELELKEWSKRESVFEDCEELFQQSVIFASVTQDESIYFFYRVRGDLEGHVFRLSPNDRWDVRMVSLGFEDFLKNLIGDPVDLLEHCDVSLKYESHGERFEVIGFLNSCPSDGE